MGCGYNGLCVYVCEDDGCTVVFVEVHVAIHALRMQASDAQHPSERVGELQAGTHSIVSQSQQHHVGVHAMGCDGLWLYVKMPNPDDKPAQYK